MVAGEAADGPAAVAAAGAQHPDVVLMDVRMPGVNGITATERICALPDPPKVIVLTTFHLDEYVFGALRAGASGFLLKDTPPTEIIQAIRLVAAGDAMLSPAVTRTLISHRFGPPGSRQAVAASADRTRTRGRHPGRAREVQRRNSRSAVYERSHRKSTHISCPGQVERGQPRSASHHCPRRWRGLSPDPGGRPEV